MLPRATRRPARAGHRTILNIQVIRSRPTLNALTRYVGTTAAPAGNARTVFAPHHVGLDQGVCRGFEPVIPGSATASHYATWCTGFVSTVVTVRSLGNREQRACGVSAHDAVPYTDVGMSRRRDSRVFPDLGEHQQVCRASLCGHRTLLVGEARCGWPLEMLVTRVCAEVLDAPGGMLYGNRLCTTTPAGDSAQRRQGAHDS